MSSEKKMREALKLADAALSGANMNMAVVRRKISEALAEQPAQGEAVNWRDHVEQRIKTWRQSFVNKSGDQLAIDDFMDAKSLDDLVDFVCDAYTAQPAPSVPESLIAELEAEANSWWQVKNPTSAKRSAATGALTILDNLRKRLAAAPEVKP